MVQRNGYCVKHDCFLLNASLNALLTWWFLHLHNSKSSNLSSVLLALKLLIFPLHQCASNFTMIKNHPDRLLQYRCLSSTSMDCDSLGLGSDQQGAAAVSGLWAIPQRGMLSCFSSVRLFVTLWTIAHEVLLSMGFSGQGYYSRLPCPPPGDLPNPETEPTSLKSPALTVGFFTTSTSWKALAVLCVNTIVLYTSKNFLAKLLNLSILYFLLCKMETVIVYLVS